MLHIFLLSREVWFQADGSMTFLSGTFFKGEGGGVFSRQKFSTACHFDLPAERQTGSRDPTFYETINIQPVLTPPRQSNNRSDHNP
jgi:hypothetical protein